MLLDEATAALDPVSEAAVWKAVEKLRARTAVLAISQQPALLEVADRVYCVEGGAANEVGGETRGPLAAATPASGGS